MTFSTGTTAICTRGMIVHRSPLPSLVTSTIVPVSAATKFAPVMPRSASRNRARRWSRAHAVIASASTGNGPFAWVSSTLATWPSVLWIAGTIMCEGRSPATCTMYSPRSVSTASIPAPSSASTRSISSVAIDFDFTARVSRSPLAIVEDDLARLLGGRGAVHADPETGERRVDPVEPTREIGEGLAPDGRGAVLQLREVVGDDARGREADIEVAHRLLQLRVGDRLAPRAPRSTRPASRRRDSRRASGNPAGNASASNRAKCTGSGPMPVRRRRPSRWSRHAVSPLTSQRGVGRRRVRELVVCEWCRDLAVLQRERATEAATGLRFGQLDERRAGRFEQPAGCVLHAEDTAARGTRRAP